MIRNIKQIVCISPHYWDGFWFCKQQFMSRFHKKGYKIAYIDPSFSMLRKADISKREYATNSLFRIKIEEMDNNLFIIKPFRYLPFNSKPIFRNLNNFYVFTRISSILTKLSFNNYLLLFFSPIYVNTIKYFSYRHLACDITDDLAALVENNKSQYQYLKKCTKTLVQKSDLVIVTAFELLEKFKSLSSNIHLVPNGYDSNLFSPIIKKVTLKELRSLKRPIVGFVGTLFSYLDYNLIEYILKNNMEKSFVFIGPCQESIRNRWDNIIKYDNVIWLGTKKREEIPSIIDEFDVCINPFKINELSKSVSPLKVYEYLAMKKPVVSVEMESLKKEEIGKLMYFAKNYDEFNTMLNYALKNPIKDENYHILKKYSWDCLFNKVFDLVENLIESSGSG